MLSLFKNVMSPLLCHRNFRKCGDDECLVCKLFKRVCGNCFELDFGWLLGMKERKSLWTSVTEMLKDEAEGRDVSLLRLAASKVNRADETYTCRSNGRHARQHTVVLSLRRCSGQ